MTDFSGKDPEEISKTLLQEIVGIIKKGDVFDLRRALSLCHHPDVTNWMAKFTVLESIKLILLSTQEEKLTFFINLTNALWLHAIFTDFRKNTENFETIEGSELLSPSKYSDLLSPNVCERIVKQSDVKYVIGELGSISLFGLKYLLLIKDSCIPKYLEGSPLSHIISISNFENLSSEDYLPSIEPRCLFVLIECFISNPKVKVHWYCSKLNYK